MGASDRGASRKCRALGHIKGWQSEKTSSRASWRWPFGHQWTVAERDDQPVLQSGSLDDIARAVDDEARKFPMTGEEEVLAS